MIRLLRHGLAGLIVLTMLTVSTAACGFAHRAPSAEAERIAAAALAGLDVADVCAGERGDIHGLTPDAGCHLDGAVRLLPAPGAVRAARFIRVRTVPAPRESRAIRPVLDPGRGWRAPPRV